jgi:hypothetical protein
LSAARRTHLLGTTAAILLSLAPGAAHARSGDHLRLDVGAGAGIDYGLAGVMTGLDVRIWRGMGVSANVGMGAGFGGTAYLWSPGERVRFGTGASVWRTWEYGWAQTGCDRPPMPVMDDREEPSPCEEADRPPRDRPDRDRPPREAPPGPPPCESAHHSWGALAGSLQTALDHDFGDPGGFAIRYGLGLAVVGAGDGAVVLPSPSVGLRYAF